MPEKPKRRVRYKGRNPRKFEDKYKELAPEKFPGTIGKVMASGKTPAGSHVPVLVEESLDALCLAPGQAGVDCTLGYGGHAMRILERISPGGRLIGLDVDPLERPRTLARMRAAGWGEDCFDAVQSNYAGISKVLAVQGCGAVDFVFADLGCSSMQLDNPARGFSFKQDGKLDMRMNPARGLPASEWLARADATSLARILHDNADEPMAELLASGLAGKTYTTTRALASAVRMALGGYAEGEAADLSVRRVFQAIRIEINDEFGALDAFLRALPGCLKAGGRAVVLTFHSGEDRRVKKAFQAGMRAGVYAEVSDGVVTAGSDERRLNPRSIPAKLRWVVAGGA
jgi:16S rRNA (cytosine1402-N4)-methyltransferase